MSSLLLIDGGSGEVPRWIRDLFPAPAHGFDVVRSAAEGLRRVRCEPPDVVLVNLVHFPCQVGPDVVSEIRRFDGRIPVIFLGCIQGAGAAIEATQQGAFAYLPEPLHEEQVRLVVGNALDTARRLHGPVVTPETQAAREGEDTIVGNCPAMREVYKAIGQVAAQVVPVLITGESGTGKELAALAIHRHSPRAGAAFRALNCAAIPEPLLESELFGHERGAFTGADRRHVGIFEQCSGGTLFLDEVGDMSGSLQAKLLRVLQEQAFERVGGVQTIHTDARVVAATNRDLKRSSAEDRFRPELYYRLGVFVIHLPPLRERGDDIPALIHLYLRRFSRELGRMAMGIAPEALARLCRHSWPGNIRELQSVLKQAILKAVGPLVLEEYLPADLPALPAPRDGPAPPFSPGPTLADLERDAIQRCLTYTGGNRIQSAHQLGISTRTLLRKIRKYRLDDPLHEPMAPQGNRAGIA